MMALLFLSSAVMVSCGDDPEPEVTKLVVDETKLTFGQEGGSQFIHLSSNSTWTAVASESWIVVSDASGEGDKTISVTAATNTGTERQAYITIRTTDGAVSRMVSVSQSQSGTMNITLKTGYTYTIPNGSGLVWTSDNPSVAKVEDNVITAFRIGTAVVSTQANGGRSVVVNCVASYPELYPTPYMVWGASRSQVKAANSGYQIYVESDDNIVYNNIMSASYINYSFTSGQLDMVVVTLKGTVAQSDIIGFLDERYGYLGSDSSTGYELFITLDRKVMVIWNKSANQIAYVPVSSSNSSSVKQAVAAFKARMQD